jgi:hypothetical protein
MFNNLNNEFKMLPYCFNISIKKTGIIKITRCLVEKDKYKDIK